MRGREVSQNLRLSSVVNEQDQEHAIESSQTQVQHFCWGQTSRVFLRKNRAFCFIFVFLLIRY